MDNGVNQITGIWDRVEGMLAGAVRMLPDLILAIVVFVVFYLVAKLVSKGVGGVLERTGRPQGLRLVLARVSRWGVLVAGLLLAMSIVLPSFTAGNLIEMLGIGGVAVGFAFRDIFQNFLAGILLLLTEPFKIGDTIVAKEYEGVVDKIETRATFITTYDNQRVVIPNADLFTSSVIVRNAFAHRRFQYDFGVAYGADLDHARQLVLATLNEVDGVLAEPAADLLTLELADSSVVLRGRWWVDTNLTSPLVVNSAVVGKVKQALDAAGIEIPFPARNVFLHQPAVSDDGGSGAVAANDGAPGSAAA